MHPALATVRKPILVAAALGVFALALLLILTRAGGPSNAFASSHAEAPLISQDPRADNTDLYAFVSPDNTNTVTMIANYIPLESPASGPNFYSFDDTVLYEIKIDNSGDGEPDLGYQFRFNTTTKNPNTFLSSTTQARSPRSATRAGTDCRPTASSSSTSTRTDSPRGRARCSDKTSRLRPTTSGRARRRTTTTSQRPRSRA